MLQDGVVDFTPRRFHKTFRIRSGSSIELSHHHVKEPWSSARRATARRRSLDRILVAGVEIKMPSMGGSQWEALSFMHAAERQAIHFCNWLFISVPCCIWRLHNIQAPQDGYASVLEGMPGMMCRVKEKKEKEQCRQRKLSLLRRKRRQRTEKKSLRRPGAACIKATSLKLLVKGSLTSNLQLTGASPKSPRTTRHS
eukprot:481597-Pelagomonas_calceolata.AAC.1